MGSIIVALPKSEDARKISELLNHRGLEVTAVCTTGAAVLAKANELDQGVVVCSKNLPDMYYAQLASDLPDFFEMLLLTSTPGLEDYSKPVVSVKLPLRASELVSTLDQMLTQLNRKYKKAKAGPKKRSTEEQMEIDHAKRLLMDRNGMTEQEAFRYIQKCSMDSGTNMVETAQMITMMQT